MAIKSKSNDLMISDTLAEAFNFSEAHTSIKVVQPLSGDLQSLGSKNGLRFLIFVTSDIVGAFELLEGKSLDNPIITYGDSTREFTIEDPECRLECLGRKIKVILQESSGEK